MTRTGQLEARIVALEEEVARLKKTVGSGPGVLLSALITFEMPKRRLRRFSVAQQKRLDTLMAKNNEGRITETEREELRSLVREAEEMALTNARVLVEQGRRLAAG